MHVQNFGSFWQREFFLRGGGFLPSLLRGRSCTQNRHCCTGSVAITATCATTPLSLGTKKQKCVLQLPGREEVSEMQPETRSLATSVKTLRVDFRRRTKQFGAKEKARRKKCDLRFSLRLSKGLYEDWFEKAVGQAVGIASTERLKMMRQMAAAAGNKESVSLSLFTEVSSWEVEEDVPTMATLSGGRCGEGELVSRVHTLVAGVVQVYHRLHAVEEKEKWRKVEQEAEREDQGEETAHIWMAMEMT